MNDAKKAHSAENISTVLVVDDSTVTRHMLETVFPAPYRVLQAEDGTQALELLCNEAIDVVLLDLMMPVMDGLAVLREMRNEVTLAAIPVIAITSIDNRQQAVEAIEIGAQDVLFKPFNAVILRQKVENLLTLRSALLAVQRNELRHDALTGLLRRSAFVEEAAKLIAQKDSGSYVISCFDVDGFKAINDRFGHEEGDRLLRYLSNKCSDMVCHWGGLVCRDMGDVFFSLLPNKPNILHDASAQFFEHLRNFDLPVRISSHIGRYLADDTTMDVNLMLDRALMALRSIKRKSDERVMWFNDEMRRAMVLQQELTEEMQPAMEDGQFVLFFQPQYNYSTRTMVGAEALVRWEHPQKGVIPPSDFIPLFERTGQITQLDLYVWEQTCRYLRKWLDAGLTPVPISVNISRSDIRALHLAKVLAELVAKYDLPPSMLRLEITESAYLDDAQELITAVKQLQRTGFTVEMDDFGTGYSSLGILKDVPVDILKLDITFIKEDRGSTRGGSILSSVVRMAHWLRLPVIAEGVETQQQADYLKSIGCHIMQGYYFHRPMPAAEQFEVLLRTKKTAQERFTISGTPVKGAVDFFDASIQSTLLFNSFVGGAAIVEYDGQHLELLRANDLFYKEIGYTGEEFEPLGLDLLLAMDAPSCQKMIKALEDSSRSGDEGQCEIFCPHRTAGRSDLQAVVRIRFLAQHVNRRVYYAAIDNITERMHLMEKAQALTQEMSHIFGSVPGGIIKLALHGTKLTAVFVSEGLSAMTGISTQEWKYALNESFLDRIHPDDRAPVQKILRTALLRREDFEVRHRLLCWDGHYIWVSVKSRYIAEPDSEDGYYYSSITDVTKTTQNEKELLWENARTRLLLEKHRFIIWDYDFGSDRLSFEGLRFAEGAAVKQTVEHFSEAIKHTHMVSADAAKRLLRLSQQLSGEETGTLDYQADLWGIGMRWCRLHYVRLSDEQGKIVRLVGIVSDIQAEKERESTMTQLAAAGAATYEPQTLAEIFAYLYSATDEQEAIAHVLCLIGEHYGVSRVYIFENSADKLCTSNTFEWCAPGVSPKIEHLQQLSFSETFGSNYMDNFDDSGLFLCPDVDDLPDSQQAFFSAQGIHAMLQHTIANGDTFSGFIGFDDCVGVRNWTDGQIGTLSILSELMGLYLYRHRTQDSAQLSSSLLSALENNSALVYIVDPTDYTVLYANKALEADLGAGACGRHCYELVGENNICKNCVIRQLVETGTHKPMEFRRRDGRYMLTQPLRIQWSGKAAYMMMCTEITAQKQSEEAQRIMAAENAIVLRQSGKYVLRYDVKTNLVTNLMDAFALLGLEEDAYTDDALLKSGVVLPESEEALRKCIREIHDGQAEGSCELRLINSSDQKRWFHLDYALICSNDQPDHAILSLCDTTQQREASELRERLQTLTDTVPGGIMLYQYDSTQEKLTQLYFNDELCRISGYTRSEYVALTRGMPWGMVYPDDEPIIRALFRQIANEGKQIIECEYRIQGKDDVRWLRLTGRVVDAHERKALVYVVVIDITAQKQAEKQLKFRNDCLEILDTALSAGTVILPLVDGRPLHISSNIIRFLGYSVEEISLFCERGFRGLIHPDDLERIRRLNEQHRVEQPDYYEAEFRFVRRDGSSFWVMEKSTLLPDFEGQVAYLSVFVDITAQVAALHENEQLLRIVAQHSKRFLITYDFATDQLKSMQKGINFKGSSLPKFSVPSKYLEQQIIAPESRQDIADAYTALKAGKAEHALRFRIKNIEGKWVWISCLLSTVFDEAGKPNYAIISLEEITGRYEQELAFQRYQRLMAQRETGGPLYFLDYNLTRNTLERYSDEYEDLVNLGFAQRGFESCIKHMADNAVWRDDRDAFLQFFDKKRIEPAFASGITDDSIEVRFFVKSSQMPVYLRIAYQMVSDPYTNDTRLLLTGQVIDKAKRAELELLKRANTDAVTGILNRAAFIEQVQRRLSAADKTHLHAFISLDIDHFKAVNDTFGHVAGDKTLETVAHDLTTALRKGDLVGRLGGDEFGVFIGDVGDKEQLCKTLERINRVVQHDLGSGITVSASVGVTLYGVDGTDFDTLYRKSDIALYQVKANGRNGYAFYRSDMPHQRSGQTLTTIDEVPEA